MSSMKKGLDKWDLGTPMIAGLLGGTADYGEGAELQEEEAKKMEALNSIGRPGRKQSTKRTARQSTVMT